MTFCTFTADALDVTWLQRSLRSFKDFGPTPLGVS
jgi:hypothetical protein